MKSTSGAAQGLLGRIQRNFFKTRHTRRVVPGRLCGWYCSTCCRMHTIFFLWKVGWDSGSIQTQENSLQITLSWMVGNTGQGPHVAHYVRILPVAKKVELDRWGHFPLSSPLPERNSLTSSFLKRMNRDGAPGMMGRYLVSSSKVYRCRNLTLHA